MITNMIKTLYFVPGILKTFYFNLKTDSWYWHILTGFGHELAAGC